MQILVVAATRLEVAPLAAAFSCDTAAGQPLVTCAAAGHQVDVLIAGIGMVATAAWCARALAQRRYDFALNLGVCGTFDRSLPLGTVVHVVSDHLAELGAEDGEHFLTMHDLRLVADATFKNSSAPANSIIDRLPRVAGITVNTVHGSDRSIAAVVQRLTPQVESMEGAAFMYACTINAVPFAQVRAISNVIEKRNRAAWNLPLAIGNLGEVAIAAIEGA